MVADRIDGQKRMIGDADAVEAGRVAPVATARTPGIASAAETSSRTIRPAGTSARSSAAWSVSGRTRSIVYFVRPRSLSPASRRGRFMTAAGSDIAGLRAGACAAAKPASTASTMRS